MSKNFLSGLKKLITPSRLKHSLATAKIAVSLAQKFSSNPRAAYLAAILHDCARDFSAQELLALAKKYRLKLSTLESNNPILLHGKVGAKLAASQFKIKDPQILQAIRCHTLGNSRMVKLAKIIYLADFLDGSRTIPAAKKLRDFINLQPGNNKTLNQAVAQKAAAVLRYARKKKWQTSAVTLKLSRQHPLKGK